MREEKLLCPGLGELTQRKYLYLAQRWETGIFTNLVLPTTFFSHPFPCILPFNDLSSHPDKNRNSKATVGLEHNKLTTTLRSFFPVMKTQLGGILNGSSKHSQMDMTEKHFHLGAIPNPSIIYCGIKQERRNTTGKVHLSSALSPGLHCCWAFVLKLQLSVMQQRAGNPPRLCLILLFQNLSGESPGPPGSLFLPLL